MLRGLILTIALCAALAIAGCGGGGDDASPSTIEAAGANPNAATSEDTTPESSESESTQTKPKVEVPSGPPPKQLESEELVEGTGPVAKAGDEVTVQYVGVDYESGEQFDASWDRGEPFTFTLGAGEVIPGWDQGVEGMKVGGRRELIIPPELAYGSQGVGPIAPNSTLVFVVDLLAAE
ncbi:MAG: FKBP-type peptidyl-prolyl cis-trans isomerase [Solirubrobacterales bacterium]